MTAATRAPEREGPVRALGSAVRRRGRRRAAWTAAGLVAALVAVLLVEVVVAVGRQYLPNDPGYVIDVTAEPAAEAPGRAGAVGAGDVTAVGGTAGGAVEPVRVAMLGDSTVAGVGAPSVEGSLPAQVAQRVADALGRPVRVVGFGVAGARTADIAGQAAALGTGDPMGDPAGDGTGGSMGGWTSGSADDGMGAVDAVVVCVGSNDVTHVTPFWVMDDRTAAMLRAVRRIAGAPVVLGGIPRFREVPSLDEPLRSVTDAYGAVLRRAQRDGVAAARADLGGPPGDPPEDGLLEGALPEGVAFVDLAALASPRFFGRPASMSSDGFHPSPLGYGFWADALAPAVVDAVTGRERDRGRGGSAGSAD